MSSRKQTPLVSFIVLNWNGLNDTKKCIESINKIDYAHKELIVVDNGSTDGSKDYLRSVKGISFVDLPKNIGFTGGHIAGRKVAKGDYLAIINNDLVLDKNWLNECLATFNRHNDAAVVGGKAFKWDAKNPAFNTNNEFYSYQEVDPETGHTRTLLTGEEECPVDSISGAALLIKQSCLKLTGYLDDNFFAYYEETDLIARLMRAGFRAYYSPNAWTWHKVAASSNDNPAFYLYMMHRNRYFFAVKNLDDKYLRKFIRNYRWEVIVAILKYLKNSNNLEARCRIKAYRWIIGHRRMIFAERKKIQKLGDSYTDKLKSAEHNDVTIVIPCHNYGQYVADTVNSALGQTVLPKKIIVINDGSTDNSKEVIDRFKSNPLVEVIHQSNRGVVDTKNRGIKLSKTYWTVFLDADDELAKNFLETTIKESKNGAKDVVYTDMHMFGSAADYIFRARTFSAHTLLKKNYINNTTLIKTSLLKQIGGYKPIMSQGLEDWELYISLAEIGAKPAHVPLALVNYRQHENHLSRNTHVLSKEKELIQQIKTLHRSFYRQHPYYGAIVLRAIKWLGYFIRYPGVFIVFLLATPPAAKQALSRIYRKGWTYIQGKID